MKHNLARFQKGFTLVELVIVIALLAALALGILAALDPLEQIRKGQDTAKRDIATQFYTAAVRFYASKECMPWTYNATTNLCNGAATVATATLNAGGWTLAKTNMTTAGELKSSFDDVYASQEPNVYATGTATDMSSCYQPQSKTFKSDSNTKYTNAGVVTTCTIGPTNTCYWCAK